MVRGGAGRGGPRGGAAGLVGSLVIHAAMASFLFTTVRPPAKPSPPAYEVNLVAAPAPSTQRRLAREAVPTPAPPPVEKPAPVTPKPVPKPEPKPTAKPAPVPKPAEPTPAPAPRPAEAENREPAPPTQAPIAPAEGETPGTGSDAATINTPGLAFPFPAYLRNIVNQVYQRWNRSAASRSLSAEVSFLILSDGAVRDIRVLTSSGNFSFDVNAQGAIELAGNARAFGPLPAGWQAEVLPVSILFKPMR